MIEVVACDVNGTELPDLGRRFHDRASPEVMIDGAVYDFVRFTAPGVALYRRRRPHDEQSVPSEAPQGRKRLRRRGDPVAA